MDGKSLLRRSLEAVPAEEFAQVTVVTQYDAAAALAEEFGFTVVRNDRPEDGLSRTVRLGTEAMAGCGAYSKIEGFGFLPITSFAMALTTFVGQNLGVGDTARAKKGVRTALYLSFAVTAVLLVPVLLLAPDLTAFFNSKAEVVSYGALLLRLLSPFYFFFCINQIYSAALRGAGNSQVPMWIMLGSFVVFRQIYLYIVANYVSNEIIPIAMSYPAGWFVCSVATLIYYRFCKFDSHRLVEDV